MRIYSMAACLFFATRLFAATPPKPFQLNGQTIAPADVQSIHITYNVDVQTAAVKAHAEVSLKALSTGFPIVDLVPEPTALTINGQVANLNQYPVVNTPQFETRLRYLKQNVNAGEVLNFTVDYDLTRKFRFESNSAASFFDVSDMDDRQMFEMYGPANFEYDNIDFSIDVNVLNTTVAHRIFTNGTVTERAFNQFHVTFPSYFTSSSIFFHLAPSNAFVVKETVYNGIERAIPMIVYGYQSDLVDQGIRQGKDALKEFETLYGSFAHEKYIVYISPEYDGGMEYCGAAISSLDAQRHETNHSWFARGVMPGSGAVGWLDEAIATWAEKYYQRASGEPDRFPVNMANFSAYQRFGSYYGYTYGEVVMEELDFLLAPRGGLQPVLKAYYGQYRLKTVDNLDFQKLVETALGRSLDAYFKKYVYGEGQVVQTPLFLSNEQLKDHGIRFHKRHTTDEILSLSM